ncbi:MAG: FHA domain-containing protein [Nostocoides sp.]
MTGPLTCPNGHQSSAGDYCDICGVAMPASAAADATPDAAAAGSGNAAASAAEAGPTDTGGSGGAGGSAGSVGAGGSGVVGDPGNADGTIPCPNCGAPNPPGALFCEACGYDHTTGTMPRREPASPGGANPSAPLATPWVAEVWVDAAWYATQTSADPIPSPGAPVIVALRHTSLLIGRPSVSRGITPDIDCGMDSGVSRRQAQLTSDGTRWWIEDLGSANGTFLGDAVGDLPTQPIPAGQRREIDDDARIYVGAWTRIVVRPSAADELASLTTP